MNFLKSLSSSAILPCTILLSCLCADLSAQVSRGCVKEGLSIESAILGRSVNYAVYLPYDYYTSNRSYPVVYLLHGLGDDETGWVQFGEIQAVADAAIAAQQIAPMIIVMPDGKKTWYINNFDGSCNYEDFFFKEFIPAIETSFRIRSEKRFRGIAGLSMGGYGSLIYSFKHPEMFAACAAFSAGVHTDDEILSRSADDWNYASGAVFGPDLKGADRLSAHYRSNSVLDLAATLDKDKLSSVRFYLDCGDDDFLTQGNSLLHMKLCERGIYHENRMRDGGHKWSYWRSGIKDGLAFISTSFHQD